MTTIIKDKLKQPRVIYLSVLTGMSERFGYYIIGYLLTLYVKSVYHFSDAQAFTLFAIYTALGYLTPAIGGYLADNVIGIKRCLGFGLLLEAAGYFILALPTDNIYLFYLALGFVIIGCGIFKTTPTNIMGRAYEDSDPRIDSGFTLYYMGINIGSFSSGLIAGPVLNFYGWYISFLIAGLGLIVGFIWFIFLKHYGLEYESKAGKKHFNIFKWSLTSLIIVVGIIACAYLMYNLSLANYIFYICSALVLLYLLYEIISSPKDDKIKIIVCLILIGMAAVFFALYYQVYESMILFINRNVNRDFLGIFTIPTATFPSFDALSVILLSPILAALYNKLEKKKKDLAITTKIPLGIFITSSSFFLLTVSTYFASSTGRVSCLWIIAALFVYTIGEMLVSALGLAMITRIAPERLYGIMMGTWFLIASALGAALSGDMAHLADVPVHLQSNLFACLKIYGTAFFQMGAIGAAVAVVGFIIAPWLKKVAKI